MIGIYKITNLLSGKVYIGQSTNIEERIKRHKYASELYINEKIQEIGYENFGFEILELCEESKLDEKEIYYINLYKSNIEGFGYNISKGGKTNIGEFNANAKISENDIYNIREAYNNHENKYIVYEKYKDKISKTYFSNLWEGVSWNYIHMDVYTEENINYYKYETSIGEKSYSAIFTNDEVLKMRKEYETKSATEIYETVKNRCSFQTLQSILWGRYYSNLPIYSKRHKKWIIN